MTPSIEILPIGESRSLTSEVLLAFSSLREFNLQPNAQASILGMHVIDSRRKIHRSETCDCHMKRLPTHRGEVLKEFVSFGPQAFITG